MSPPFAARPRPFSSRPCLSRPRRSRAPWWLWATATLLSLPVALVLGLALHASLLELPAELARSNADYRVLNRSGQTLAVVRDGSGELSLPVQLDRVSPWLVPALLAAEDARFHMHPGVDPLALARALVQAAQRGRIVSGASTITQQLARTLFERPRTLAGKWREMALAVRLERELDKNAILEAYLERVDFGPRLRGVEAASRRYFDKPAQALSLAEAAALVAIVRGPTRYDPARASQRLIERRNHILARMRELGFAEGDMVERARRAPLALHTGHVAPGAFHFVRAALQGRLGTSTAPRGVIASTLDARLQHEVETLVRGFAPRFAERRASAAAVVVVENASGAVRAYVGSPDYRAEADLGQNDGALALRQPGSTLKPFIYALALGELGLHAASILPDLERRFVSRDGTYVPHNYDRRFHGPVRLSQALASSLNVPAATLAERLGPERVVRELRRLGFAHLEGSGADYGPGIALGVAEVQLVELAGAYRTLASGGSFSPLRFFENDPAGASLRVLSPAVSRQIADILADPRERAASFGRGGPLEFDVPVAVKTGTSKGNRDNWVVGFDEQLTVGVWVGNFDGTPMLRSSGATGAGPLFHAVMDAARRALVPGGTALSSHELPYESRDVCERSGELATPFCPHTLPMRFWTPALPAEPCSWHRSAQSRAEPGAQGLSPRLTAPDDETTAFGAGAGGVEIWPERFAAWGHRTGSAVPAPGSAGSIRARDGAQGPPPEIEFPKHAARFVIDQNVSREQQQLVLSARASADELLSFELDGQPVCEVGVPFTCPWPLRAGRHTLVVRNEQGSSRRVGFTVE